MASYQGLKYSAQGLITKSRRVSGAKDSTAASRECSRDSSQRRGAGRRVRSISVTGAPSARNSGTAIDSSMCWTMCTEIRVSS